MMRTAVLAAALALAPTAHANPDPGRLAFDVLRNGEQFGTHVFEITESGDVARLSERARFSVDLGPINFYRYEHECAASWRGGQLQTLACSTLKDGRRIRFSGARDGDAFITRTGAGAHRFGAATPPSFFIHTDFLRSGAYIDTETGRTAHLRVTPLGSDTITVAGRATRAQKFRIEGSLAMDAWYGADGRWIAARFNVGDQRIEYRLR